MSDHDHHDNADRPCKCDGECKCGHQPVGITVRTDPKHPLIVQDRSRGAAFLSTRTLSFVVTGEAETDMGTVPTYETKQICEGGARQRAVTIWAPRFRLLVSTHPVIGDETADYVIVGSTPITLDYAGRLWATPDIWGGQTTSDTVALCAIVHIDPSHETDHRHADTHRHR